MEKTEEKPPLNVVDLWLGCFDCATFTGPFQNRPHQRHLPSKNGARYHCRHCDRVFVVRIEEKDGLSKTLVE